MNAANSVNSVVSVQAPDDGRFHLAARQCGMRRTCGQRMNTAMATPTVQGGRPPAAANAGAQEFLQGVLAGNDGAGYPAASGNQGRSS